MYKCFFCDTQEARRTYNLQKISHCPHCKAKYHRLYFAVETCYNEDGDKVPAGRVAVGPCNIYQQLFPFYKGLESKRVCDVPSHMFEGSVLPLIESDRSWREI